MPVQRDAKAARAALSQPGPLAADPDVAATMRLLHRRQGWGRTALTSFLAFALAYTISSTSESQGTPPPFWFSVMVIVLGALTVVGIAAAVVDTVLLRRRPPAARAQAVPAAAHHPSGPHAHHYPPRHWVTWAFRWFGMLLLLFTAVVSVPAVVDGMAYLAGAENTVTFDPVSYQTNCQNGGCQTSTDGILETGGAGTDATWPAVVPLGQPFQVREPAWRWGLGESLINSEGIAAFVVLFGLGMDGFAVLVMFLLVKLLRNGLRYRRQRLASAPVSVP